MSRMRSTSHMVETMYKYQYSAFGLNIGTEFPLPELPLVETSEHIDVSISLGQVPHTLADAVSVGTCFQTDGERFLFCMEGVARILGEQGQHLTVDLEPDTTWSTLRLFLLGPVAAGLLLQRGYLPLNGSCICINGKVVILTGFRDAGKSSVAAALSLKGHSVLADDLVVIYSDKKSEYLQVVPSYPRLKLWPEVLQQLGIQPDSLPAMRPGSSKRSLMLERAFVRKPLPVEVAIDIQLGAASEIEIEPLNGLQKFRGICARISNEALYLAINGQQQLLGSCAALAKQINMYRATRPFNGVSVASFADEIERIVHG